MSRTRRRIVSYARENRLMMSKAEGLVWWSIRRRLLGHHFRRQHPMGPFIADFACLREKLIVEIDGQLHSPVRDAARDRWFAAKGFRTLRIDEDDVLQRLDDVVGWIAAEITEPGSMLDPPQSSPASEASGVLILPCERSETGEVPP